METLKTIVVIFFLAFFAQNVFSGEGVVVVLEAPLLEKPDLKSNVLQTIRKGDHLYIHNKHFIGGPLTSKYIKAYEQEIKIDEESEPDFYLTIDKTGQDAYIPREYVKLIYGDVREYKQAIRPFSPDPLDYRLPEPLPDNYPLPVEDRYRATVSAVLGPDLKSNYPYNDFIEKEEYSMRTGFMFSYLKNARWDEEDRYYFGGTFHIWSSQSEYALFSGINTTENRGQIGLGPVISYDSWKNEKYLVNLTFSVSFNIDRVLVEQEFTDGVKEERSFSGYTWTPKVATSFHIRDIFEKANFFAGAEIQIFPASTLKTSTTPTNPDFWNTYEGDSDQIDYPLNAIWSLVTGIQFQY